jgi:hypothetical protein
MSNTEWTDAAAMDDVPEDRVIGLIVAGRDLAMPRQVPIRRATCALRDA